MIAPHVDSEAENLLKKSGYVWSDWLYAYRRARQVDRQSTREYLARLLIVQKPFHGLFDVSSTIWYSR